MLKEEKRSLKDKLEKVYEFMKQFVIGGMNLLEKFLEWIGEKVKDVGRVNCPLCQGHFELV